MATTLPNRHRWTEPTATRGWNYTTSVLTKEMHACRGGCEREGSTRALYPLSGPRIAIPLGRAYHCLVRWCTSFTVRYGGTGLFSHRCDEASECPSFQLLGRWKGQTSWYTCGSPMSTSSCVRTMLFHSLPPCFPLSLYHFDPSFSSPSSTRARATLWLAQSVLPTPSGRPFPPFATGAVEKVWPWTLQFRNRESHRDASTTSFVRRTHRG